MRISDWSSDVCSSDLDQGGRSAAISRDKHMNKFVVAGLLAGTLFGGAALAAQTAPAPDAQPRVQRTMPKIDTDGSGTIGRAEMLAAAEARFTRRAANGDGQLSGHELRRPHQHRGQPGPRRHPGRARRPDGPRARRATPRPAHDAEDRYRR